MDFYLDENSTRNNIILLLKKHGGMTIDELSKLIDITPMGIRQHLLALEKKGLVSYVPKKRGIGRPGFTYMLTEGADDLFPKAYDKFALGILKDIKKYEGAEKINKIFEWRKDRLSKIHRDVLAGNENIDDTVIALKRFLEAEGHLIDLEKNGKAYHLKQYHCPISKVAVEFKDVCAQELQLYRDVINKNITREQTLSEGAPSCLYLIPRE
jgi:predicted ArsR family transcriptional regulator